MLVAGSSVVCSGHNSPRVVPKPSRQPSALDPPAGHEPETDMLLGAVLTEIAHLMTMTLRPFAGMIETPLYRGSTGINRDNAPHLRGSARR